MSRFWKKILLSLVLLLSVAFLFAQADTEIEYQQKTLADIYAAGGPFMNIITGLLVIMLVISIIKYWKLAVKEKIDTKKFYLKLKGYIRNKQYEEAAKISGQFRKTTLGFMFEIGIKGFIDAKKAGKSSEELQGVLANAFDEAGLQKIPDVEAGLFWLDTIAQVSTLLGLLGTIFGLIEAFDAVGNAPEAQKSSLLSGGISKAMGTTAYGLIVAIPTMFIKGGLKARATKIVNDIDEYSVKTVNQITYSLKD